MRGYPWLYVHINMYRNILQIFMLKSEIWIISRCWRLGLKSMSCYISLLMYPETRESHLPAYTVMVWIWQHNMHNTVINSQWRAQNAVSHFTVARWQLYLCTIEWQPGVHRRKLICMWYWTPVTELAGGSNVVSVLICIIIKWNWWNSTLLF